MKTIIGVIGSGEFNENLYKDAVEVGKLIAERNYILVCGGLGGVMEASCKGAKSAGGTTIGILPGKNRNCANEYIDICIPTGLGEARNIIIVNSSHAIIAIGGGFGTLSEISFALKSDTPVIGLHSWDVSDKIIKCENPQEAVNTAFDLTTANSIGVMRHKKNS